MRTNIKQTQWINGIPRTAVTIEGGAFSVEKTFDCGQAFRFDPPSDEDINRLAPDLAGSGLTVFAGVAAGKYVMFAQDELVPDEVTIINADENDVRSIWLHYLALDEDYDAIDYSIETALPREDYRNVMKRAISYGKGIRILRQNPWEAIISFIISQNNNIPRIKKIISAMCQKYGTETDIPGKYAFPTAESLLNAGTAGLSELKTGFRAKYIIDAAERISSGDISIAEITECGDFDKCLAELKRINGVGPKVGSCALLFGFGKTEAFPVDVWIKKSLALHFPDGIDVTAFGKYAGIAQQYLFYYERYINSSAEKI